MKALGCIHNVWKPLILSLLVGCASEPQNSAVKPFPGPPPPQYALLFFYIDRHDSVRAHPTLQIDGTPVVKLPNDSYTWCYIKPGLRVVRCLWDDEHAGMNAHLNFEFKGGESAFLRFTTRGLNFGPGMKNVFAQIEPVSAEIARAQIASSEYRRPKKDAY